MRNKFYSVKELHLHELTKLFLKKLRKIHTVERLNESISSAKLNSIINEVSRIEKLKD